MKYSYLLLIILIAIGIYSCEKDEDEFPITYSGYELFEHEVKIYTNSGEITTPELQQEVIQLNKSQGRDFKSVSFQEDFISTHLSEVIYLSDNSVQLTIDNEKEVEPRIVHNIDGVIYWEKDDTTQFPAFQYGGLPLNTNILEPLYRDTIDVPKITGYSKLIIARECYYAMEQGEELKIPMFEYKGYIYSQSHFITYAYPRNNIFNENCYSSLGDNDTLVVQQYFIKMKKINR